MAAKRAAATADNESRETPLIRQYLAIKQQHPDHVLFFRCGDFYEMFFDDARLVAEVLGVTLTRRGTDADGQPIPLAGLPYHSVEPYLAKMMRAGYRVAVAEQMENPKNVKGVVKREVVRVVTPGTILEDNMLDGRSSNYLVALVGDPTIGIGLAAVEFSTGEFSITQFQGPDAPRECRAELMRLQPSEVVLYHGARPFLEPLVRDALPDAPGDSPASSAARTDLLAEAENSIAESAADVSRTNSAPSPRRGRITALPDMVLSPRTAAERVLRHLHARELSSFGADDMPLAVTAAAVALDYLGEMQRGALSHVNSLTVYHTGDFMHLDATTQRSLELVQNLNDATRRHTLLDVLDRTTTSMGARLLRSWILQPLRRRAAIEERLAAVTLLAENTRLRTSLRESLRAVLDLERIVSRASTRTANARDLLALAQSLAQVPAIAQAVGHASQSDAAQALLAGIARNLNPHTDLTHELTRAIVENPPAILREGGFIRDGYHPPLDELRALSSDSKSWIATMRQEEVARTGISNLKIGFNRVFGYYIEVTASQLANVPSDYIRKQTIAGGERFITQALKEKEEIILHAEERSHELEFSLFEQLREKVAGSAATLQATARALAQLDCLAGLAHAAVTGRYCAPTISDTRGIRIAEGRHPVIESLGGDQPFVPNDTYLDPTTEQVLLITGPNMAGKSTFIRQVALITLMAHMGSWVPAREATIGTVDRIFTRVGAMDQLARGQSTFLVEMTETANILNNATDNSLVILDEIGRGTSTYDGLSIAWSVVEYLHNSAGHRPMALFATHYHELVELEGPLARVRNYSVAVLEEEERVAFLYRIVRGSTDRSYGIYAAQVAGLPKSVVARAREILSSLEASRAPGTAHGPSHAIGDFAPTHDDPDGLLQLTLFDYTDHPALETLRTLDANALTPLEALTLLHKLAQQVRKN